MKIYEYIEYIIFSTRYQWSAQCKGAFSFRMLVQYKTTEID